MTTERRTADNSIAIGGVFPLGRDKLCSSDSFPAKAGQVVVAESFVLRITICAEKPAHRKSANRWRQSHKSLVIAIFKDADLLLAINQHVKPSHTKD